MSIQPNNSVIACNLGAIDPAQRTEHMASSDHIFTSVLDIKETPNGYAFQLPLNPPMLYKVASFISNERLCCSFFTFTLIVDRELWFELSGTAEVKTYIHDNIVKSVRETGALDAFLKEQVVANVAPPVIHAENIPTN